MAVIDWFRPPRSVLTLYLAGAATAMVCLTWLAVRQLSSDELAEAQRIRQRLAAVADRVAVRLQQGLRELDQSLDGGTSFPDGAVLVRGDAGSIAIERGILPFLPLTPPSAAIADEAVLAAAEAELHDPSRAIQMYREVAQSAPATVRAYALLGLGRTLRKTGRPAEAIAAYAGLAAMTGVVIEGRPVDMIARIGRCRALREGGQAEGLAGEAAALRADLTGGKWPVTGAVWRAMFDAANECDRTDPLQAGDGDPRVGLASAVETFWRQIPDGFDSGGNLVDSDTRPALIVWRRREGVVRALVVEAAWLERLWRPLATDAQVDVALIDRDIRQALGRTTGEPVLLAASATGLPWTVAVADAHPDQAKHAMDARRRTFLIGLSVVGMLIVGSGYFTFRGIRRELAIARMHADFVSAASHEFRTPLTSIRQLSHMLKDGRVESDDRRGQYYNVLVRESERLHRLVERLLSFGRADAGRVQAESIDARDLAATVAADFQQRSLDRTVEVTRPETPCPVRVDREMLSLALWNLLDNAVRDSPAGSAVSLDVSADSGLVRLAVRDRGAGIPAGDQRRIFEQFVRGADTGASGAPGSGLGLALVERIVRAHGGDVRIDSEVGRGSLFTISLPREATT